MDKESRNYREHSYPALLESLPSHDAQPLAAYVEAVCDERDRNHRLYREQVALTALWEQRATEGVKARATIEAERDKLRSLWQRAADMIRKRFPDEAWADDPEHR